VPRVRAEAETPAKLAEEMVEKWDADANGLLDREEYMAMIRSKLSEEESEDEAAMDRVRGFYERLFAGSDIDGDGSLGLVELEYSEHLQAYAAIFRLQQKMQEVLGEEVKQESEGNEFGMRDVQAQLDQTDVDGNGLIDREEYLQAMKATAELSWGWKRYVDDPEVEKWLLELFDKADVTGDGALVAKEVQLVAFLGDEGYRAGVFADRAFANMFFEETDTDGDGRIDEEEVKVLVGLSEQMRAEAQSRGEQGQPEGQSLAEQIHLHFAAADADGDKALDAAEAAHIARLLIGEL